MFTIVSINNATTSFISIRVILLSQSKSLIASFVRSAFVFLYFQLKRSYGGGNKANFHNDDM